jgi:hypothetical protein
VRDTAEIGRELIERVAVAREMVEASARLLESTRSHLEETQREVRAGRSAREVLHESAFARLQARLESLPVIEQAKGILMAQTGCCADEAFDLLRRASQRSNVPVRDLAAEIVLRTSTARHAS